MFPSIKWAHLPGEGVSIKGQDPVPPEIISDGLGTIAPSSFSTSEELWVGRRKQQFKNRRTHVQKDILSFPTWLLLAGSSWEERGRAVLRPSHCLGLSGGSEPKPPPWAAREN